MPAFFVFPLSLLFTRPSTMKQKVLADRVRAAVAAPELAPATLTQWRATFCVGENSFDTAVDAGLMAGQLAFCFAGGYQAALRRLLPSLPQEAFAALLLSEGKRQRPDELLTTLTPVAGGGFRLDGEKSYVTGGAAADPLLVVARHGVAPDGRVRTVLAMLPPGLPGITCTDRADVGFLAALPHGRAKFDGVYVEPQMLMSGDGWVDYARPFRTIEDTHVSAAVAAYMLVHGLRFGFPDPLSAALFSCLVRLGECAQRDATDPIGHLLLAGAERELQQAAAQVNDLIVARDDDFARDWRVNHLLVALAAPARAKRLQNAMALLKPVGP